MRILFATDGSRGALAAGEFLRSLAFAQDIPAQVHIVTVTDTQNGDALLGNARASLKDLPVSVTTETLPGGSTAATIDAILAAGDAMAADLILLGATGHSAIAQFFVGSVADSVARRAHRSVLLVRPNTGTGQESAIVGVDSSASSRAAVLWAAGVFPLPSTCALHLVAVVPSQTWTNFAVPSDVDPSDPTLTHEVIRVQTVDEERHRAESHLKTLAGEATAAANSADTARQITTAVRQGIPADELIHAAEEGNASLIVVAAQGHTVIDRILIGSVSERVLRHSACSVLIVRTPPQGERSTQ